MEGRVPPRPIRTRLRPDGRFSFRHSDSGLHSCFRRCRGFGGPVGISLGAPKQAKREGGSFVIQVGLAFPTGGRRGSRPSSCAKEREVLHLGRVGFHPDRLRQRLRQGLRLRLVRYGARVRISRGGGSFMRPRRLWKSRASSRELSFLKEPVPIPSIVSRLPTRR